MLNCIIHTPQRAHTLRQNDKFDIHVTMHRDKFLIIKPTRCTNFSNLFWNETLHVSDSCSVHHQEFFTVHTAMVYDIHVCWQLARCHQTCMGKRRSRSNCLCIRRQFFIMGCFSLQNGLFLRVVATTETCWDIVCFCHNFSKSLCSGTVGKMFR
jgi:hypothetical protein